MGIYDRAYMDDRPERLREMRRLPAAALLLTLVQGAIWIVWHYGFNNGRLDVLAMMGQHFNVQPGALHIYTFFSAVLSHIDMMHLGINLVFLWVVGEELERIYGAGNFIILYLVAGAASLLAVFALDANGGYVMGASGAIAALITVAVLFTGLDRHVSIFGQARGPLWALILFYAAADIAIGFQAGRLLLPLGHLAGVAVGFIFWTLDLRIFASPGRERSGMISRLRAWWARRNTEPSEEIPIEVVPVRRKKKKERGLVFVAATDPEESQRVDTLLSKISLGGLHSLTTEERAFLDNASKHYRRKP